MNKDLPTNCALFKAVTPQADKRTKGVIFIYTTVDCITYCLL